MSPSEATPPVSLRTASRTAAGGSDVEQCAAVQGEVSGDPGAEVAADHQDALPGEVSQGAVVHGVELLAGENGSAGDGREEGPRPAAGGADDRLHPPGAGVGLDQEPVAVAAFGVHTGAVLDGQVVALLVVGKAVHHVPGIRVGGGLPRWA